MSEQLLLDNISLEDDSITEGSTADVEEDELARSDDNKRKKRKIKKKKKKVYYRSDFVGNPSSSEDEDDTEQKKNTFAIQDMNPVWFFTKVPSPSANLDIGHSLRQVL